MAFSKALAGRGFPAVTTEICDRPEFLLREAITSNISRKTRSYCGLGGTGVACPIGPRSILRV